MFTLMDAVTVALIFLGSCCSNFFFCHSLTPKYSFRKTFHLSCLIFLAGTCISYTFYDQIPFCQIFNYTVIFVSCRILYLDAWYLLFFSIVQVSLLAFACDYLIIFLMYLFCPEIESFPQTLYLLVGNLMFDMIFVFCVFFFLLVWKKKRSGILSKSIYAAILFPVSQFFMLQAVVYYIILQFIQGIYNQNVLICIAIGTVLCIFADIMLFQVMLENSQKERLAAQP